MTTTVYGIPNCDSVKKARTLLDGRGIAYVFHDYKKQGVPAAALRRWVATKGWEVLLNRKGTTWRALAGLTSPVTSPGKPRSRTRAISSSMALNSPAE